MRSKLQYHPAARIEQRSMSVESRTHECTFHATGGFCSTPCKACDRRIDARKANIARADARRTIALMRAPQGR